MFLKEDTIKSIKILFTTPQGKYIIVENTKKEVYEDLEVIEKEHLPNYLVVNRSNGAIESATDQFPSACHMGMRLEEDTDSMTKANSTGDDEVRMVN